MNDILKDGFVGRAGRRTARDARIRKDDVKFTEIAGQGCEEPLAIFRNGDVGTVTASVRSKFRDGFIQRLLIATGDGNLRAFRDEKPRCSQTDAAVTASNKSLLACELHNASFCYGRPSNMMPVILAI